MQPSYVQPGNLPPQARSMIDQYIAALQKLSPLDLQAVQVQLQATLSTSALSGGGSAADYKVPSQYDFIGFQMEGYIRLTALASEAATNLFGYLNLSLTERILLKAQNCTVNLQNIDKKHTVIENNDLVLASLLTAPCGYGGPKVFPKEAPILVPAANTLRAAFALQDSTAGLVGQATVYGVTITGVLIPTLTGSK